MLTLRMECPKCGDRTRARLQASTHGIVAVLVVDLIALVLMVEMFDRHGVAGVAGVVAVATLVVWAVLRFTREPVRRCFGCDWVASP